MHTKEMVVGDISTDDLLANFFSEFFIGKSIPSKQIKKTNKISKIVGVHVNTITKVKKVV